MSAGWETEEQEGREACGGKQQTQGDTEQATASDCQVETRRQARRQVRE